MAALPDRRAVPGVKADAVGGGERALPDVRRDLLLDEPFGTERGRRRSIPGRVVDEMLFEDHEEPHDADVGEQDEPEKAPGQAFVGPQVSEETLHGSSIEGRM